jgi:hypothetical protein
MEMAAATGDRRQMRRRWMMTDDSDGCSEKSFMYGVTDILMFPYIRVLGISNVNWVAIFYAFISMIYKLDTLWISFWPLLRAEMTI